MQLRDARRTFPLLTFLVVVLGGSVPSGATGQVEATPSRTWTGAVVDLRDGMPLAGVVVNAGSASALTDGDGRFFLLAEPGQQMRLSAASYRDGVVRLAADLPDDLGTLVLEPATAVRGRIVGPDGPLVGTDVYLAGGPLSEERLRRTVTDVAGRFRIDDVASGRNARHALFVAGFGIVRELRQLTRRAVDLGKIELPPKGAVEGRIVGSDGTPLPGARVILAPMPAPVPGAPEISRLVRPETVTDARGRFSLALPPGPYALLAGPATGIPRRVEGIEVESGRTTDHGTVRLPDSVELGGRIEDGDGDPVAGAQVEYWVDGAPSWPDDTTTVSGAEGCFRVGGLPSGASIRVTVRRDGHVPLRSVQARAPRGSASDPASGCGSSTTLVLERATRIVARVVDGAGAPVEGASLSPRLAGHNPGMVRLFGFEPEGDRHVMTDVPAGEWSVRVRAPGFFTAERHRIETRPGETTEIVVELDDLAGELDLTSHAVRALDPSGRPVPDATVSLTAHAAAAGRFRHGGRAVTGADGRTRFEELPVGWYTASVRDAPGLLRGRGLEFELTEATPPTVLRLAPAYPTSTLSGRVVGESGDGIAGAVVEAQRDYARSEGPRVPQFQRTVSEADGRFRFDDIGLSTYTLVADLRGHAPAVHPAPVVVDEDGSDAVRLVLRRGARVSGTVEGLGVGQLDDVHVRMKSATALIETGPSWVDGGGSFHVLNVPPGEWTIEAMTRDGREARSRIRVPPDADLLDAAVRFTSAFRLTGSVTFRGEPAPDAGLSFYPRDRSDPRRSVRAGPDGRFELADVLPGEYDVTLWAPPFRSPTRRTVVVDGNTDLDLVLRGGVVAGRVVDAATGRGLTGVHMVLGDLENLPTDSYPSFLGVAADGSFRVGPLSAGRWELKAEAEGYVPETATVEVGDEDLDLEIPMDRTPGLRLNLIVDGVLPADQLELVWQSLDGDRVLRTYVGPTPSNELYWAEPPLGPGILTGYNGEEDVAGRAPVENRGEPVDLVLGPAGRVVVHAAGIEEPAPGARLRVLDTSGRPVPGWGVQRRDLTALLRRGTDEFRVGGLVPGTYTLEVTTPDGRTWRGRAQVEGWQVTEVTLPPSR